MEGNHWLFGGICPYCGGEIVFEKVDFEGYGLYYVWTCGRSLDCYSRCRFRKAYGPIPQ